MRGYDLFCEKYVKRARFLAWLALFLVFAITGLVIMVQDYREMAREAMTTSRVAVDTTRKLGYRAINAEEALAAIQEHNEGILKPKSSFTALVTAYTPYSESTGKSKDHPAFMITRSGWKAGFGTCAADTRYWPFGTVLYVEGYGFCVVADTGGAIKGPRRFDVFIWFPGDEKRSVELARKWGKRKVKVHVIEVGRGSL